MGTTGDAHDQLIGHLFTSGLTLAAVLSLDRLDAEVADRLRDVVERLDTAIGEIRHFALAALVDDGGAPSPLRLRAVPTQPERQPLIRLAPHDAPRRTLCRFAVDDTFAYATQGHDFYRAADDELWAHESDGYLLAAHSGTPFAHRRGRVYYEVESEEPLYYERP
jgi:hypothetical protein